jgi:hypothetical protein
MDQHLIERNENPLRASSSSTKQNISDKFISHQGLSKTLPIEQQERSCFICLDGRTDMKNPADFLLSCCSQCFAVAHRECWADWRGSQAGNARRTRITGNRISSDPFLCTICKSGLARVEGERVSLRWLESFTSLVSSTPNRLRAISGLFSALSGSLNGTISRGGDSESTSSHFEEDDFFDFIDAETENDSSTFLCGNSKRYFALNMLGISLILTLFAILGKSGGFDTSFVVMAAVLSLILYGVVFASYVISRYTRIVNQRVVDG